MSNCNTELIRNEMLMEHFVYDMIEVGAYQKHIKEKIEDFINYELYGEEKNWYELKNYFYNPNVDDITLLKYIKCEDEKLYERIIQLINNDNSVDNIREKIYKTVISLRLNSLYDEIVELLELRYKEYYKKNKI